MRKVDTNQKKEAIAILDAIKAYADKYGESYLSFFYFADTGTVNMHNDIDGTSGYYSMRLYKNGEVSFDICRNYEVIRERKEGGIP